MLGRIVAPRTLAVNSSDQNSPPRSVRHTWSESERFVPRAFVRPFQRFMQIEAAGGVILLASAVVALVWVNSPWGDTYTELWETRLAVELGHDLLNIDLTLVEWINDGLMTLFFFVVGLEIKRELVVGELRDPRAVALPAIAALGGMLVPAAIYLAFNAGTPTEKGWGIPMATDIAFAVGIVALVGDRIPSGAKLFLLTLAIADDIGAIVVIAVFYTDDLSFAWLGGAVVILLGLEVAKRMNIRAPAVYLAGGAITWFCLLESGVHATLAGVALGLMSPVWSFYDPRRFAPNARALVDRVENSLLDDELTSAELEVNNEAIEDLQRLAWETLSPLERIENKLTPWVAFGIVPLFALANAGVEVTGDALGSLADNKPAMGVIFGLVVGKTVGILSFTFLTTKLGLGKLPAYTTWRDIVGLAATAGVGFTVALFVAGLAFEDPLLIADAKIGILLGSTIAGIIGYTLLRSSARTPPEGLGPSPVEAVPPEEQAQPAS